MPASEGESDRQFAEQLAGLLSGGGGDEDSLIGLVAEHTLQLDGDQLAEYLFLRGFKNPVLDAQLDEYIKLKRHIGSAEIVLEALASVSLRKFISVMRFNVNTTR